MTDPISIVWSVRVGAFGLAVLRGQTRGDRVPTGREGPVAVLGLGRWGVALLWAGMEAAR